MQYIILDLEWNQAWPGSTSARLTPGIHGEIIQIGAVRLLEDQTVADEFQILVRPHFYRRLNKKISSLTGIKEARLRAEGVPFPEAMARFHAWCGEDVVFLTWGFDDIMLLQENLGLYQLPVDWVQRWYNAQMIFNAQTDGASNQRALGTAMEMLHIDPSRPAHDALGDAYHTALICARLDLPRGIGEYRSAVRAHENGFHGAEMPECLLRRVYHGFADKKSAIAAMGGPENLCPQCGAAMSAGKWISQPGRRYMTEARCPEHGKFLLRVRLQPEEGGTLQANKLLYGSDSEAAQTYARALANPPRRRRRRKKSRKPSPAPEAKKG